MAAFPQNSLDLFQKKAFGAFTTLMPDGSPQTTPVWVDYANGEVLVNSALGRQKDKNVRRDPRVAITLIDPYNPYRYVEVRGRVTEITEQGADDHINKMAKKYLGQDVYPFRQPGEKRVIYKVRVENAHADAEEPVDLQPLHAKIGQLTLENDFLEGALTKAGLLSAKR